MTPDDARREAGRRKTIVMPWVGRNAAIIAARIATPKLPHGWGSGFNAPLRVPRVAAPALPDSEMDWCEPPDARSRPGKLLAYLKALATVRAVMPGCAAIGLALGWGHDSGGAVSDTFGDLAETRQIVQLHGSRSQFRGERLLRIVESGAVLRTQGAPAHWWLSDAMQLAPEGREALMRAVAGSSTPERLLSLLHLLAARRAALPGNAELAALLGLPADPMSVSNVSSAFMWLNKRGTIRRWSAKTGPYAGESVVLLRDTGHELRSALAPAHVSLLAEVAP